MSLWLIFDMDGVIVDTAELKISLYKKIFHKYKLGVLPIKADLLLTTRPSEVFSGTLADECMTSISQEYTEEYDKYYPYCKRFLTDVQLNALQTDGVKLVLMTAQPRRRVDIIIPCGTFDEVISEEDLNGNSKSESHVLMNLLDNGDSGILVGDENDDIRVANQCGLISIFAGWGYTIQKKLDETPAYVVDTPHELILLLNGLLEGSL